MTPVVAAAASVASSPTVRSVAARAFEFARSKLPAVAENAEKYLGVASGGKSLNALLSSKSPQTNQAVVKALLDNGLPAASFIAAAQLTAEEARQYAQMVASYQVKQQSAVDAQQTAMTTTGDAALDAIVRDEEIESMLNMLGISSDSYATLLRCVNSHTSEHIEQFQLHRKVRKLGFK